MQVCSRSGFNIFNQIEGSKKYIIFTSLSPKSIIGDEGGVAASSDGSSILKHYILFKVLLISLEQ